MIVRKLPNIAICALLVLAGCNGAGQAAGSPVKDKPKLFHVGINTPVRKVYVDIYVDYTILYSGGNAKASALHSDLIRDFIALFKAGMNNNEELVIAIKPITCKSSQEIPVSAIPGFSKRFNQGIFIAKFEDNDDKEIGASAASRMIVKDVEAYGDGLRAKQIQGGTDFTPMLNDLIAIAQGKTGSKTNEHRIAIISDMIPQNRFGKCLVTKSYGANVKALSHLSSTSRKILLLVPARSTTSAVANKSREALKAAIESIGYRFEEPSLGEFVDKCDHILDGTW